MNADQAYVAWNTETKFVLVGDKYEVEKARDTQAANMHNCLCGGDWGTPPVEDMTPETRLRMMLTTFHTMVVRDGIDPQAAHAEFCKVDEYCLAISPDIKGAKLSQWG